MRVFTGVESRAMVSRAAGALVPLLDGIQDDSRIPLYRRLYSRLRGAILDGTLSAGHRLPSARTLARDLGCSRVTVENAITQLQAEGLVVRQVGAGTFVSIAVPDHVRLPRSVRPRGRAPRTQKIGASNSGGHDAEQRLSRFGQRVATTALGLEPAVARALIPCMPALDSFPYATWHRLLARCSRRDGRQLLGYGDPAGYRPLREAVASYLKSARGVRCEWQQVIIVTSTQQAVDLTASLLLDPGEQAWYEEPGYRYARAALIAAGVDVVPIPVDGSGMRVDVGIALAPKARLAYVTPSHQYPLGVTMSLERRLALLAWARAAGAWILEDDYDSEFRYAGRPLAAVQGLDQTGHVIYTGTFNKILFPSLRLAYLVVPPALVDAFVTARALQEGHAPTFSQATLTDFLVEGHFTAHIRQMRALYRERRDALIAALAERLGDRLELGPSDTGMHVTGWLPTSCSEDTIVNQAATKGVELRALAPLYMGTPPGPGLVLGYSSAAPAELRRAVRVLEELLAQY
ncbi:MAG: PLP-dependent aminotransferase family protein [bacterium]